MPSVAIAGASGYTGGELLRLVHGHPALELGPVLAASAAGRAVTELHPGLPMLAERTFEATAADRLAEADLALLALPHGESAALVAELPEGLPVVDLGADHRLLDPADWDRYYGGKHAGTWTYGLPELAGAREAIAASHRVANPGCYVTAATLALAPLLTAGLVAGQDIVVVAASGTSGAGRTPRPSLLGSEVMGSMSAYKAGGVHQHTPEITQNLRAAAAASAAADHGVSVSFTPTLAPMSRGILATCTARSRPGATGEALRAVLEDVYGAEPYVHLLAPGQWPSTAATAGSNSVHLQVALDEVSGRATVVAALDNLVKGAAGQALQNVNLMLGLPETAGLTQGGVAP